MVQFKNSFIGALVLLVLCECSMSAEEKPVWIIMLSPKTTVLKIKFTYFIIYYDGKK